MTVEKLASKTTAKLLSKKIKPSQKGKIKVTITLPKLAKGKHTLVAGFVESALLKASTAKKVTLTVKK